MATKPEFLASKKDILVALATVLVAILSLGMAIKILCLPFVKWKRNKEIIIKACVKPSALQK